VGGIDHVLHLILISRKCSGDEKLENKMFRYFDRISKQIDAPSVASYFETSFVVGFILIIF
jgi:hypothetical protein